MLTESTSVNGVHENHSNPLEKGRRVGDFDTLLDCSVEYTDFEVNLFTSCPSIYSRHNSASFFDLASLD